jgi:hypothetical protein
VFSVGEGSGGREEREGRTSRDLPTILLTLEDSKQSISRCDTCPSFAVPKSSAYGKSLAIAGVRSLDESVEDNPSCRTE